MATHRITSSEEIWSHLDETLHLCLTRSCDVSNSNRGPGFAPKPKEQNPLYPFFIPFHVLKPKWWNPLYPFFYPFSCFEPRTVCHFIPFLIPFFIYFFIHFFIPFFIPFSVFLSSDGNEKFQSNDWEHTQNSVLKQNHSYRFPKNCDARNERSSLDLDISVYPFFYPFLDAQKGINPGFGANPGPRG